MVPGMQVQTQKEQVWQQRLGRLGLTGNTYSALYNHSQLVPHAALALPSELSIWFPWCSPRSCFPAKAQNRRKPEGPGDDSQCCQEQQAAYQC